MGEHRASHSRLDPSSHPRSHSHDSYPTGDRVGSLENGSPSPTPLQALWTTPGGGGLVVPRGKSRRDEAGPHSASPHHETSPPYLPDSQENGAEGIDSEKGKERVSGGGSLRSLWSRLENKRCADCREAGTDWVSVNLGLFLCVRCAGVHRSLGTHISRVKSITMDAWLPEEVALLQELGNKVGARLFESNMPKSVLRTPVYTDQERTERIRRKYETLEYAVDAVQSVLKRVYKKVGYGKYKNSRTSTSSKNRGDGGEGRIPLPAAAEEEEGIHSYRNPSEKDVAKGLRHSKTMNTDYSHKSKAQWKMERMEAFKALYGEESPLWASENLEKRASSSSSEYPGRKWGEEGMPPVAAAAAKEGERESDEEENTSSKRYPNGFTHSIPCHPRTSSSNMQRVTNERGIFGLVNVPDNQRDERLKVIYQYFEMDSNASAHPKLFS